MSVYLEKHIDLLYPSVILQYFRYLYLFSLALNQVLIVSYSYTDSVLWQLSHSHRHFEQAFANCSSRKHSLHYTPQPCFNVHYLAITKIELISNLKNSICVGLCESTNTYWISTVYSDTLVLPTILIIVCLSFLHIKILLFS